MDARDLMAEAGKILDRAASNVMRVLADAGVRITPATHEKLRGVIAAAIAEGIALGERFAAWRRGRPKNPFPEFELDEDITTTRPGFRSKGPPPIPPIPKKP
jgi:hypothetical protein